MANSELPMGLALVICDTIIEDRLTGKKSLIGLFSQISASKMPCIHQSMMLMVSLTGGRGTYPCQITCEHPSLEKPVFQVTCPITFDNPFQVLDLIFKFQSVRFPQAEQYWITVKIDDVPVMMRPLTVLQKPSSAPADNDNPT